MSAMKLLVTTVVKADAALEACARELAAKLSAPYAERRKRSLPLLRNEYGCEIILVATRDGPVVHTAAGEYFFHLNLAELRIKNLIDGKHDHMTSAMGLTPGLAVLDCTLGLATDAIVASYAVGQEGRVVGLEASPVIAVVTGYGLANFVSDEPPVTAALRRVTALHADYNEYLTALPAHSFDVVYFDPMFRSPVEASASLRPLRPLADPRPLTAAALCEATRVARLRVVMKEAAGSAEFSRLGFSRVVGGKYSSIHYGVLETGG